MTEEQKKIIEREYHVPLREETLKAPKYKRGKKAVKVLKEFMVRHMKIYDRDLRKIRVDNVLNNEILFRGMKKPLASVHVKAIKYENGEVEVKLVNLPKHVEFALARKAKRQADKVIKANASAPKAEEKQEETKDVKEKEEASKLATEEIEKAKAKEAQHTSKTSQETPKIQRKALKR